MLRKFSSRAKAQKHFRYKTDYQFDCKDSLNQVKLHTFNRKGHKSSNSCFPLLEIKASIRKVPPLLASPTKIENQQKTEQKMIACQNATNIATNKVKRKVQFIVRQQEIQIPNITKLRFRRTMTDKENRFSPDSERCKEAKYLKGKLVTKQIKRLLNEFSQDALSKFNEDLESIYALFKQCLMQMPISQKTDRSVQTQLGKLIFFMGVELERKLKKEQFRSDWLPVITKCLHFQIYYGIKLKIYPLALEALLQCARLYSNQRQYEQSQYFCENALKMAVDKKNRYYEESALDHIGLCQYKKGNLDQARMIHENISNFSLWSKNHFLKFYHEQRYLSLLYGYLYDGDNLPVQKSMKLIQTIAFDSFKNKGNTLRKSIDRLVISTTNKCINEFRINQEKSNDLRKESNQAAIKSIRFNQMHRLHEQSVRSSLESNKIVRHTQSSTFQVHQNVMKTHESLNRSQDKYSDRRLHLQKNIKLFFTFIQSIKQSLVAHKMNGRRTEVESQYDQ